MKTLSTLGMGVAVVALASVVAAAGDDAKVAEGKKLTVDTCANDHCHGGSAPSFDDMKGVTEARIRKAIAEGLPDKGMQSFRGVFTPEQVDDIVAYVLAAAGESTPQPVASHRKAGPKGPALQNHFVNRVLLDPASLRTPRGTSVGPTQGRPRRLASGR